MAKKIDLSHNRQLNKDLRLDKIAPASKKALNELYEFQEKHHSLEQENKLSQEENQTYQKHLHTSIETIYQDKEINVSDKESLLHELFTQYSQLMSFSPQEQDYQWVKKEVFFLKDMIAYSFLLLAQRLKWIRDYRLYEQDGYASFRAFIEQEIHINRQSAYNYIALIETFGVQTFGQEKISSPSKLIPVISLLRKEKDHNRKEDLKKEFIHLAKVESARSILQRVKNYEKQIYGADELSPHKLPQHSRIEYYLLALNQAWETEANVESQKGLKRALDLAQYYFYSTAPLNEK